ncbi:YtxH domain-containing protein [Paenibacillus sp. NPDC058071]|uniref:YtxH domain-containing protein n=1 Tax=Paenibacillus sp. NPDC058071 TaxID=3346326 RepID=UPI0036D7B15E
MSARKQSRGFIYGALAGGVVGSITALLLAPKAGKELRKDLAEGAHKVQESTVRAANRVGDTTGRIARQIGDQASHIAGKAKEAAISVADIVRDRKPLSAEEIADDIDAEAVVAPQEEERVPVTVE